MKRGTGRVGKHVASQDRGATVSVGKVTCGRLTRSDKLQEMVLESHIMQLSLAQDVC